jgi:hypothetical protein
MVRPLRSMKENSGTQAVDRELHRPVGPPGPLNVWASQERSRADRGDADEHEGQRAPERLVRHRCPRAPVVFAQTHATIDAFGLTGKRRGSMGGRGGLRRRGRSMRRSRRIGEQGEDQQYAEKQRRDRDQRQRAALEFQMHEVHRNQRGLG